MSADRERRLRAAQDLTERRLFDRAVIAYRLLLDELPNDARTWLRLADLYVRTREHGPATDAFARAAQLFEQQGFLRRAIAAYAQALEAAKGGAALDDRVIAVARGLARLHEEEGLPHQAIALLRPLVARLAREANARVAAGVLRVLVALDPEEASDRVALAEALAASGERDAAADEMAAAAEILAARGATTEAIGALEQVLALRPDAPRARLLAELYVVRARDGDGARALMALRHACVDAAHDTRSLSLLAAALRLAGHVAKAAQAEALLADVHAGGGRTGGARHARAARTEEEAIDDAWGELDDDPPATIDAVLDRADALVARGDALAARAVLVAELRARPDHALLAERLADVDAILASTAPATAIAPRPPRARASDTRTTVARAVPAPAAR